MDHKNLSSIDYLWVKSWADLWLSMLRGVWKNWCIYWFFKILFYRYYFEKMSWKGHGKVIEFHSWISVWTMLLETMSSQFQEWCCQVCSTTTLPFNNIEGERQFLAAINHIDNYFRFIESDLIFHPFELNNSDHSSPLIDIDPDVCFYNSVDFQLSSNCNYHDEMSFCENVSKDSMSHGLTFSMCHINIRSMQCNFAAFMSVWCI